MICDGCRFYQICSCREAESQGSNDCITRAGHIVDFAGDSRDMSDRFSLAQQTHTLLTASNQHIFAIEHLTDAMQRSAYRLLIRDFDICSPRCLRLVRCDQIDFAIMMKISDFGVEAYQFALPSGGFNYYSQ